MKCFLGSVLVTFSMGSTLIAAGVAQEQAKQRPAPHPAEMNRRFVDPKLDVGPFVRRFENDSREVYIHREAVVRAVGLRPGQAVADVGAGTGLFTHLFANQVGPAGTVYAVDISPAFLRHIAERARSDGHDKIVKTVKNAPDSIGLAPGSIDVVFLCDTYHHFDHPGEMLASMHRALRPGGRLILVDFDLRKDSSAMVKMRARAPREVYVRELVAAGFTPVENRLAPVMKDEFYAEFRRAEPARGGNRPRPSSTEAP